MKRKLTTAIEKASIIADIKDIINTAREKAVRAVDHERVKMYWHIGKRIFEEEQEGSDRAEYGKYLTKYISDSIEPEYGNGYSRRQIELFRQFYRIFPIANALRSQLSWTHYKVVMRIMDDNEREFYLLETVKNNWSSRQMERQINSNLWGRLLVTNEVHKVLAVARNEIPLSEAKQIIKDPIYLEFLGLKLESPYYEKHFEQAIITHLHDFLLEMGNGFTFVARQKRLHIEGDDFFIDLVFYNRLLRSFVIVEIKTNKLNHQDIGQLQMYVNYYDRFIKTDFENPTIGILLCADKNDAMVKISLPEENDTIFASQYKLYLPSEQQLMIELKKEIRKLDQSEGE